jgi:hypothetical protein
LGEARSIGANYWGKFGPGGGLPDSAILMPECRARSVTLGICQQKPGERRIRIGNRIESLDDASCSRSRHVHYRRYGCTFDYN